ncbi:MAG: hypothetical protein NT133_06910 [Alphaproteobacteria bacterium]|nr:hypothetical protein [Alphaproteobacteria bacterium]
MDRYVDGEPLAKLIRPRGFAKCPPFQRMRSPHDQVVELRTEQTRTFGFFARDRSYVAHRIFPVEALKSERKSIASAYRTAAESVLVFWLRTLKLDPAEIDRTTDVNHLF